MKPSSLMFIAGCLILAACSSKPTGKVDEAIPVKDYNFAVHYLPYEQLYKNQSTLYNTLHQGLQDETGVVLFSYMGSTFYHPVDIAHQSLEALNDYYITDNPVYLNKAIISMETLRSKATRYLNMIYFPYEFNYYASPMITYTAPWYSGMAQGMALSAYCRLYHFTHDPLYKSVADSILNTMTDFESPFECVLISDAEGLLKEGNYYWIDEYPHHIKRYVLNGSIIGSMGLYDHWWVFRDNHSKALFSKAMTTYKDKVLLFRNPGAPSAYCLKYREQIPIYHELHQYLLDLCGNMTGDMTFEAISDLFHADYNRSQ